MSMTNDATMPRGSGESRPGIGERAAFLAVGDTWRLEYAGTTTYVRDSKGMRYLAYLLARPHQAVDVRALAAALGGVTQPSTEDEETAVHRARSSVSKRIHTALRHITEHHLTLGRHLSSCVHTGVRCWYRPDPREPQVWDV